MNENLYASPAEPTEKLGEEEKTIRNQRRLAWGIGWILWSCILMMLLDSILLLMISGASPPCKSTLESLLNCLFFAALLGIPATQFVGLIQCCFCPSRLVKLAWLHVIGSVGVLLAPIAMSLMIRRGIFLPLNLQWLGIAAGTVAWQFFLLRLARGLGSTAGVRLTWGVMAAWCMLMAGVIVYVNVDTYFEIRNPYGDPWKTYLGIDRDRVLMLGAIAAMACGGIYAWLLETLRRRINR